MIQTRLIALSRVLTVKAGTTDRPTGLLHRKMEQTRQKTKDNDQNCFSIFMKYLYSHLSTLTRINKEQSRVREKKTTKNCACDRQ